MKTALRILLNVIGVLFFFSSVYAGGVDPSGVHITDTSCSGDISSNCSQVTGATHITGPIGASYTVATLPATCTKGTVATVTDAASLAVGACVGSGSDATLAICITTNTWNCY